MSKLRRTSYKNRKSTQKSKKVQNEKVKAKLDELFSFVSEKEEASDHISIYKEGLSSFFKEVYLETNKIHILRGNNGQGKSSLLFDIANSTSCGAISSIKNRMKVSSNNQAIAHAFNFDLEYSPYKIKKVSMFYSLRNNLSSAKNNLTIYTDFSISFFRESSFNFEQNILQDYDNHSNGERKIAGINDIFRFIKYILNINDNLIKKGLNIIVLMDEPESGLSIEIQKEFYKKVRRYLNAFNKREKISITFIITSHSLAWSEEKNVLLHNINSFKSSIDKKEHSSVFI